MMNAKNSLASLTLTLTSRCNIGCGYCYVPRDGTEDMKPEVARSAVDLLGRSREQKLSLSFFGGEPFLALDPMAAALARAVETLDGRLHVTCTTNGTVTDECASALVRDHGVDLAVSHDGMHGPDLRTPAREAAAGNVAHFHTLCPTGVMARMTVTPSNVRYLVANIRSLWDLGFSRIVYQPAVELDWDARAIEIWADEHRRLGTWQLGLASAGRRGPDLPSWRRVESALRGARMKACGAGWRQAAVRTDGTIVPCYRLVFGTGPEIEIGDVIAGFARSDVIERYASLTPAGRRPEEGDCATCGAAAGCTFYCPAMGQIMLGDPRAVPAAACRLMRAQVLEVSRIAGRKVRPASTRVVRWAAAAVAAAASTCITTGCGDSTARDGYDEADVAETVGDATGDVIEEFYPGVCPAEAPVDAVTDTESDPATEPGMDAVTDPRPDGHADPGLDTSEDYYPGVCPAEMPVDAVTDTVSDIERDLEEIGPGVCPWPGIC